MYVQPANVLIDSEGHVQLADLGLSAFVASRAVRVAAHSGSKRSSITEEASEGAVLS